MTLALLSALVLAPLAAEPPAVTLLVTRRTRVAPAEAQGLANEVATHLVALGVPLALEPAAAAKKLARLGVADTAACAGRKLCIAELGRQLGAAWVIAASVSRVEGDRSLGLELVRASDESVAAKDSIFLPGALKPTADQLTAFGAAVRTALGLEVTPEPKKDEGDAPRVETPKEAPRTAPVAEATPAPAAVPAVVLPAEPPAPPKSHVSGAVLGGGAVLALAASGALAWLGLSTRASLAQGQPGPDGRVLSSLSGSEATSRAQTASVELGAAGLAGALGLGLGVAAAVAW